MSIIFSIVIAFAGLILVFFITTLVLENFGLSTDKFLDLSYAFRVIYRIFYPVAIFAFAFPKVKYKDLHYIEPLTAIYFYFLTFAIILNNLIERKYKKRPQPRRNIFSGTSNLSVQEEKGLTALQIYIFITPVAGLIEIVFLVKKYLI